MPITDTLIYDTLCEVMDEVADLKKMVRRLLPDSGTDDEPQATAAREEPE